ncbi:hypothetical protein V8C43DRAFT_167654 [Trichoderma afarasin]
MALHMARIHLDAHICTTPSDLYQKGVARVTQLQAMDVFGIAYSRALCGNMESRIPLPSPFSSPFWATMATLLLQVVLPSNDDLHRDYSISVFVLSTVVGAFMPLEESPGKASKVLAPGWLLLDKCHTPFLHERTMLFIVACKPNQIP